MTDAAELRRLATAAREAHEASEAAMRENQRLVKLAANAYLEWRAAGGQYDPSAPGGIGIEDGE